jgi:hypothetical protein
MANTNRALDPGLPSSTIVSFAIGVVVPMPTLPLLLITNIEVVAFAVVVEATTKRFPVYEANVLLTASKAHGVDVPIPTEPLPVITRRSLVPMTVEEEILNLPPSPVSTPIAQLNGFNRPSELEAVRTIWGEVKALVLEAKRVSMPRPP